MPLLTLPHDDDDEVVGVVVVGDDDVNVCPNYYLLLPLNLMPQTQTMPLMLVDDDVDVPVVVYDDQ